MQHRVLIIGTGSIGERHARCFLATRRCVVGIVETNAVLRAEIAQRYSIRSVYSSIVDATTDDWHAAVVATPANTHVPISQELAGLGIHLLIEKPLSTTSDGVSQLIETVKASKVIAGVAYVYRSHPLAQEMRRLICSRRFGKPAQLYVTTGQNFPFYRPAYRQIYYAHRAAGGGAIQDALTHLLNLGEWLVGPIARLAVDASHQVLDGVTVEDTVHLIARQGDAMASYTLNQYQAPNETILTVVCTLGTLRMHLQNGQITSMTEPGGEWRVELAARLERDDWFVAQANAFLDALEGRVPVLCTIEEAAQTLKAVLLALTCVDAQTSLRPV